MDCGLWTVEAVVPGLLYPVHLHANDLAAELEKVQHIIFGPSGVVSRGESACLSKDSSAV